MTETTVTENLRASGFGELVEHVRGLFQNVTARRAKYVAATDVDSALEDIIDSEPQNTEMGTLISKLDAARRFIAENDPVVNEWARNKAMEQNSADFDEQKERADYNEAQKDLKDKISSIVTVMVTMNEFDDEGEPLTDGAAVIRELENKIPSRINKPGGGAGSTNSGGDSEAAAIREWAKRNGVDVSARGRISQDVRDAYKAAQNAAPAESADSAE